MEDDEYEEDSIGALMRGQLGGGNLKKEAILPFWGKKQFLAKHDMVPIHYEDRVSDSDKPMYSDWTLEGSYITNYSIPAYYIDEAHLCATEEEVFQVLGIASWEDTNVWVSGEEALPETDAFDGQDIQVIKSNVGRKKPYGR